MQASLSACDTSEMEADCGICRAEMAVLSDTIERCWFSKCDCVDRLYILSKTVFSEGPGLTLTIVDKQVARSTLDSPVRS
jgi:hypothetical protein